MRKKTVEVPQVLCIANFADVQFKEMNPWRYMGQSPTSQTVQKIVEIHRELWTYQ